MENCPGAWGTRSQSDRTTNPQSDRTSNPQSDRTSNPQSCRTSNPQSYLGPGYWRNGHAHYSVHRDETGV